MLRGRLARQRRTLLAAMLLGLCVPSGLMAQTGPGAADAYRGAVVRLIVGTSAGGGYDTLARLLAPPLAARLGATVVVVNKPGAGGLAVINDVVTASPDGLDLTLANVSAAVTARITGFTGARFELTDLVWIGGIASDDRVLLVPSTGPNAGLLAVALAGRATPGPVRWSALGKTDNLAVAAALVSEAFGLRSRIVTGYGGSGEAIAALVRGEADAAAVSLDSALPATGPDTVRIAAVLSQARNPLIPDVPTIYELAGPQVRVGWLDFVIRLTTLSRTLIVAPGTPPDRVATLRATVQAILSDPAFLAGAAAQGRRFAYVPPETVAANVAGALAHAQGDSLPGLLQVVLAKYY